MRRDKYEEEENDDDDDYDDDVDDNDDDYYFIIVIIMIIILVIIIIIFIHKNLADYLTVIGNMCVHADIEGYPSPAVIGGDDLRPGIVEIKGNLLYVLVLTTGFETNISNNAESEEQKYADLIENLHISREQNKSENVLLANLSLEALGIIGKEAKNQKKMRQELNLSKSEEDHIVIKLINVCVKFTYFLFCKKDSIWPETEVYFPGEPFFTIVKVK